jgi:hypothetical protein
LVVGAKVVLVEHFVVVELPYVMAVAVVAAVGWRI